MRLWVSLYGWIWRRQWSWVYLSKHHEPLGQELITCGLYECKNSHYHAKSLLMTMYWCICDCCCFDLVTAVSSLLVWASPLWVITMTSTFWKLSRHYLMRLLETSLLWLSSRFPWGKIGQQLRRVLVVLLVVVKTLLNQNGSEWYFSIKLSKIELNIVNYDENEIYD